MTELFAIIAGSSITKSNYLEVNQYQREMVSTTYGSVVVHINRSRGVVFVQRHAADPEIKYTPPHLINKKAIISALHKLGVKRVVGFASVGSLKSDLSIGTVVIPDDFMCLQMITFFDDYQGHISPTYNEPLRQEVLTLLGDNHFDNVRATGSYVQAPGPRFETVSEIKLYATVCDIVGMTSAHEAILCKELGIAYANICIVDNMANGIQDSRIDLHAFHSGVAQNLNQVEVIIALVAAHFANKADDDRSRIEVDQVLQARWVVPVTAEQEDAILENTSVVIHEKKIVDILANDQALLKYKPKSLKKMDDHVLIPGLINSHTHAGMSMLRGYSDDLALLDWLRNDIWPAEARYMPSDDAGLGENWVKTGTELAVCEMIRGGTTCFNDMYFKPESTASVLKATGFRGVVGFPVFSLFGTGDQYLAEGIAAKKAYEGCDNISFAVAPHAPYTVHDEFLTKCSDAAKEHNMLYHIHLHETAAEVADSIAQKKDSPSCHLSDEPISPLDNLKRLGVLSDNVIAVHMTCMTEEHIQICKETGVSVVHCPFSNLKLASGFCPVGKLTEAGVNVVIGTDSTASNNSLDMFAEMKLGACLAKAVRGDPTSIPAPQALRMVTLNAAKMLKLQDKVGSLEVGKEADVVAVKLNDFEHLPMVNVITHLVYSVNRGDVTDVWVQGKQMLKDGEITFLNEAELKSRLSVWEKRIQADKKFKQQ